jgi:hypothetical protein
MEPMAVELPKFKPSKRFEKHTIEYLAVPALATLAGVELPEVELVGLPDMRVSRFDEEAHEWEITIRVRSKVRPLAEA